VLEIYRDHVPALRKRADVYTRAGRYELAVGDLEKAVELEPKDAHLWTELARVRAAARRYQEAIDACDRSISLGGELSPLLIKIDALESLKRDGEALQLLNEGINNDPTGDLFFKRAQLHLDRGDYSLAIADYQAAKVHPFKA